MTFGSTFGRVLSPTFQPKSQAAASAGGTYTFSASDDTYLVSANNSNYGMYPSVVIGTTSTRRSLFRFKLNSIPSGATCSAAKITLTVSATYWTACTFSIYQIASANGDWIQGTKSNSEAAVGDPTWNYKKYATDAWAGSAGMSTAGTDYVDTVIGSYTSSGQMNAGTVFEIPFNATGLNVVKSWFGQASNSGISIFMNGTSTSNVHSKEATTESYRPYLTVTYS